MATDFDAEVFSTTPDNNPANIMGYVVVTVGGSPNSRFIIQSLPGAVSNVSGAINGQVGPVNTGSVPIAVYTMHAVGYTCVVNVTCALMPETYRQWRQAAFDQITQAYLNLRRAYQQEIASAAQQPGSVAGLVGPPELNRARATAELRRLVIEQLMGSRFNGENAIVLDIPSGEPNVNLNAAQNIATSVQFFEQAFEWANLIYICYPYYWGRRNIWSTSAIAATQDPEFDQFLNSGSRKAGRTCATGIRGSRQLLPLHRMHLGRQTTASAERSRLFVSRPGDPSVANRRDRRHAGRVFVGDIVADHVAMGGRRFHKATHKSEPLDSRSDAIMSRSG